MVGKWVEMLKVKTIFEFEITPSGGRAFLILVLASLSRDQNR
jgi:hypothetical protein